MIFLRSLSEFSNKFFRNRFTGRERDPSLGSLESVCDYLIGVRFYGAMGYVDTALFTKGRVTYDNRFPDFESWHFVSDDLFRLWQHGDGVRRYRPRWAPRSRQFAHDN